MQTAADNTTVKTVDLDIENIDSWLGAPGADNIITPPVDDPKPNMFTGNKDVDMNQLVDQRTPTTTEPGVPPAGDDDEGKDKTPINVDDVFGNLEGDDEPTDDQDDQPAKKGGRPRTEKSGLVEFFKKRIESKEMFAFDDYDESKQTLDEYLGTLSEKDMEDLWKANVDNLKQEVASNTPKEFFESLPEELQYAAKYVMDGGQDLKGLFQALAQVEQVRELDPTSETDQEQIIRSYLQATGFGTAEEVEEELNTWKDLGVLEKKAKQFKPKLDQMQEEIVQRQLEEQEMRQQQQQQAAQAYMDNVFEALRAAEVNGLKLDKKTQAALYSGLVQPNYPSISGRPTNQLGHLLEKYQFVEPNYPLVAEALWLLSDPDGYREQLRKQGSTKAVEQTVRQLKTEQARKTSTSYDDSDDDRRSSRKVPRPNNNFFKR